MERVKHTKKNVTIAEKPKVFTSGGKDIEDFKIRAFGFTQAKLLQILDKAVLHHGTIHSIKRSANEGEVFISFPSEMDKKTFIHALTK